MFICEYVDVCLYKCLLVNMCSVFEFFVLIYDFICKYMYMLFRVCKCLRMGLHMTKQIQHREASHITSSAYECYESSCTVSRCIGVCC